MNEEQYLNERLDDQINWYDKKSVWNQNIFKIICIIEFIAAALIPFLTPYISEKTLLLRLVVGFLGVIIAVIVAIVGLYKFQEHWAEFRTTCESLKHEKYLYLTKVPPYDGVDAFTFLVERVESLISKENSAWAALMKSKKGKNK
ncbi:MAG: DUF4231 domain-containing protein [Desulfobacteraceae bacterium]|nr:DUF4231 domain-containing protein [Desulfobacteraceae bacterium]